MPKKTAVPEPPVEETRQEVLKTIGAASAPMNAGQIAKLLVAPYKLTEKKLQPILDDLTSAGTLHFIPAATEKGKARYWDRDLTAMLRTAVLTTIQRSDQPETAKTIAGKIESPVPATEAEIVPILAALVVTGAIFDIPASSAKGKPSYWDRDITVLARSKVLAAAQQADQPFTAKELIAKVNSPVKFTEGNLQPILEDLATANSIYRIPAKTASGKPRYWNRDFLDFGRVGVLNVLSSKGAQPADGLKKTFKEFSDVQISQILQRLLETKSVFAHPPLGKKGKTLYGNQPPVPEPYFSEVGSLLTQVVTELRAAQVPIESLRRVVVQIVEAAGIPFTRPTPSPQTNAEVLQSSQVDLVAAIRRIEPGADRGALVAPRDLRKVTSLGKLQFDQAVLDLARTGRVTLHRHDYVASLTDTERDELVTDGEGSYYVGLALRQNSDE